jgi:hypothetical protein
MCSEAFPTGDHGGNSCLIRIRSGGSPVKPHHGGKSDLGNREIDKIQTIIA